VVEVLLERTEAEGAKSDFFRLQEILNGEFEREIVGRFYTCRLFGRSSF